MRRLVENKELPAKGDRQTLMFSATFPDTVQRVAEDFLTNHLLVAVGIIGSANQDISQVFLEVRLLVCILE